MQNPSGIAPTDLDLSPSPRADYRGIKMEEDVRSALLSRYYKESKLFKIDKIPRDVHPLDTVKLLV